MNVFAREGDLSKDKFSPCAHRPRSFGTIAAVAPEARVFACSINSIKGAVVDYFEVLVENSDHLLWEKKGQDCS